MLQVQIGHLAAQAFGPGPEIRFFEGVVQAHHGDPVPDGLEQSERGRTRPSASGSRK